MEAGYQKLFKGAGIVCGNVCTAMSKKNYIVLLALVLQILLVIEE